MTLLDILFPKRCVGCKKWGEYVCPDCFAKLSFAVMPRCLVCSRQSFDGLTHPRCRGKYAINGCFAALGYKGVLRKILYQFKYSPYLTDLQIVLGDFMYEQLIQDELFHNILEQQPILVPIPLSKTKLRKRGYNHAEILANNLGKRLGLPVQNLLERVKETRPQYGLKREERIENIRGAFSFSSSERSESRSSRQARTRIALLIDDIVTTGSTLKEAANVLKRNGFEKVHGVTLAQD